MTSGTHSLIPGWFVQFYVALRKHVSAHLGTTSKPLYKESYEAITYPDKEW